MADSSVNIDDTALRARLQAALQIAGDRAGLGFQDYLKLKINVSARVFPKGWQASAPGEPPRKRTATLQKSVTYTATVDDTGLSIRAGTNVRYGFYLEYGTKDGLLMAARPWLRPGLAEYQDTAKDIILTYLRRELAAN